MQINVNESNLSLSQLIERVIAGEEIIIDGEDGEPIAKLVPYAKKPKTRRTLGGWKGQVWVADDFDKIPEEIAEAFGINDK
jgi:antitoxin (DNA-binding transcriptional repressor) of toxin-antitoxin stability system